VVKPNYGSLGIGVERIDANERDRLAQLLAQHGALYLQEFVDGAIDVRALVVGTRVEAAIARRPRPGEFRANVSRGAEARAMRLPDTIAHLAVRAARAIGLDYAGVDLLLRDGGATVLEVNGTPGFAAVERATGRDIAGAIVTHAMHKAAQREGSEWSRARAT
jgi:ribosomal protein S6--L-glutamate ligase